ncbi:MAG: hypothetical protein ABSB82_19110 [Terriglobia bacterium]|jgi:hypothetical protein
MKTIEYFARALALLWGGFWTLFFIAESLAWHTPMYRMAIWLCVGLVFVILALVAWRWEFTGGLMLIAGGVLAALTYGIWEPRELSLVSHVTTLLTFGVPPAAAGALFLIHHHGITYPRSTA